MTLLDQLPPARTSRRGAAAWALRGSVPALCGAIADWIRTAAHYYKAAAAYERLSRLSEAELHRRGLSRSTLARDVCKGCDATGTR